MAVPTSIATAAALQTLVEGLLPDYSGDTTNAYYDKAILTTLSELSEWSLPCTDNFQMLWFIERTKRHILAILKDNYARKFQYAKVHLEHRFKHLSRLVNDLDEEFALALENNPDKFGSIDVEDGFGSYIGSGFEYDDFGRAVLEDD
jgi:hypothetical protein